ncbi:MAG: histidine phosphatase family protein [bacterium]|nr:histidine phosphatase family protein [bacterium]
MSTFYLVRHGQKKSGVLDPDLTPTGQSQAQKTANYLTCFPISSVIASPKKRTQQTAAFIGATLSVPVVTDEALLERMELIDFEAVSMADFFTEWRTATHDRTYQPRWGSSSYNTGERIKKVIELIDDATPDAHVAVVTHGGAIADFLRSVVSEDAVASLIHTFSEGTDYRVDECSVTRVALTETGYKLVELHCTTHLA